MHCNRCFLLLGNGFQIQPSLAHSSFLTCSWNESHLNSKLTPSRGLSLLLSLNDTNQLKTVQLCQVRDLAAVSISWIRFSFRAILLTVILFLFEASPVSLRLSLKRQKTTVTAVWRISRYQVIKLIMKPSIFSGEGLGGVYCAGWLPSPEWSLFSGLIPLGIQANQSRIWASFNHFCLKGFSARQRDSALGRHPVAKTLHVTL